MIALTRHGGRLISRCRNLRMIGSRRRPAERHGRDVVLTAQRGPPLGDMEPSMIAAVLRVGVVLGVCTGLAFLASCSSPDEAPPLTTGDAAGGAAGAVVATAATVT